jgi:hypothetical protein
MAVPFTAATLRRKGFRLREHDVEDIAHDAYFYYWRGFTRTGNDDPGSYRRDILDQCDRFTHSRNKTPVPEQLTGYEDWWWEARPSE